MIPYTRHYIDLKDVQSVGAAVSSGMLTQGQRVLAFENLLKQYVHSSFAVAYSSGTAALHAMLQSVCVTDKRKRVVTTPFTFVATANAILYAGLEPVFADVRADTLNLDPHKAAELVDKNTCAVLSVDYAGQAADMNELRSVCRANDLQFLSDSCHSFGADYRNQRVGSIADLTAFSFHPSKTITTGEGGAVVGIRTPIVDFLLRFRDHGRDVAGFASQIGYNYRMSDIHAALGISQLEKANLFVTQRLRIAEKYYLALAGIRNIELPVQLNDRNSSWHLYPIRVPVARREKFRDALRSRSVSSQVHYRLITEHPRFRRYFDPAVTPVALRESKRVVSIPLFPSMSVAEVQRVINAVRDSAQEVL